MNEVLPFWRLRRLLLGVGLVCGCHQSPAPPQQPSASVVRQLASSSPAGVKAEESAVAPNEHADPTTGGWELAPPKSVTAAKKTVLHDPAAVFVHYCSVCHGAEGRGDGQYYSDDLPSRPANLTDQKLMNSLTDEHLAQVITSGSAAIGKSPLCPPWGRVLSKEQIVELVAHIRQLPTQAAQAPQEGPDDQARRK